MNRTEDFIGCHSSFELICPWDFTYLHWQIVADFPKRIIDKIPDMIMLYVQVSVVARLPTS